LNRRGHFLKQTVVRQIIRRVDADQPISDVMTASDLLALQTAPRRAQVNVLVALAAVALLRAGLGSTASWPTQLRSGAMRSACGSPSVPSPAASRAVASGMAYRL
jgi:hypothetical protein